MKAFENFRVAAVVEDRRAAEAIADTMRSWGLCAEWFTQPAAAFESIRENKYDIILLEVLISDVCCRELIPQFGGDLKIIIVTGLADRDTAVQALKFGAFDLLVKPFQNELLYHSIYRALTTLDNERKSKRLIDDLTESRSELLAQQQRVEKLNTQLQDINGAMWILAENIKHEREEFEKRIVLRLRNLIIPIVTRLRDDRTLHKHEALLNMLTMQVENLTCGLAMDSPVDMTLSCAEMQVASFVKNGFRTEEIAKMLYISENTVRTHRKNIRRKLKINDTQYSLRNFLTSKIQRRPMGVGVGYPTETDPALSSSESRFSEKCQHNPHESAFSPNVHRGQPMPIVVRD